MKHIEKRGNVYLAVLTVPEDVRHSIGKLRYVKSTETGDIAEAGIRAALLVSKWKAEIARARGKQPKRKDSFWDSLRSDYIAAQSKGDEDLLIAIESIAKAAAAKKDSHDASNLWAYTTNQVGTPLASIIEDWKAELDKAVKAKKRKQKGVDQAHRDVLKMAEHFVSVEALQPQRIKQWADKLRDEGTRAASFERIGDGCRSLWAYMKQVGTVPVDAPCPFNGPLLLVQQGAEQTTIGRVHYTADQAAAVYQKALEPPKRGRKDHVTLSRLVALGAYTGARIEELCLLTKDTVKDGVFMIAQAAGEGKTLAAKRHCPIHPAIAPLVKRMLAESKDGYLVPTDTDNKYETRSSALSKQFGRLKTAMGFNEQYVFHSFRRTLITLMQQAGVPEAVATDVVGHEKGTMTYGLYSGGSSMAQMRKAIAKVKYPAPLDKP